jgi:hypothetical protein
MVLIARVADATDPATVFDMIRVRSGRRRGLESRRGGRLPLAPIQRLSKMAGACERFSTNTLGREASYPL